MLATRDVKWFDVRPAALVHASYKGVADLYVPDGSTVSLVSLVALASPESERPQSTRHEMAYIFSEKW